MNAQDLVLNISVNLGRLGRWAADGKTNRISQFIEETENFLKQLEAAPKSKRFEKTYEIFKSKFEELKQSKNFDAVWAEDMLTWANILSHRAKLT